MKKITKLLSLTVFVGLSLLSRAQNGVVYSNPSTSSNPCNGYAQIVDSISTTALNWYQISNGTSTLIQTSGNVVLGLCWGEYILEYSDSSGINNETFFIDSLNSNPCSSFYVSNYPTHISAPNLCDGSVIAVTNSGVPPFTYLWDSGQTSDQILNLCTGLYTVTVTDASGCIGTSQAYLYADSAAVDMDGDGFGSMYDCDDNNPLINPSMIEIPNNNIDENCDGLDYSDSIVWNYDLQGYVYKYLPSVDEVCDGSAYVDIFGGTAPYTFLHSNGDLTQYPQNLCSGIYSVNVTDANGDMIVLNYVIANPSEVYNGGNYSDSVAVDTLDYVAFENCLIDYLTLDSTFISDVQYISYDSIVVIWSVIDGNGTINISQSYTISTGIGVYELMLSIFCPQKSENKYIYAIDRIFFNSDTLLSIEENISKVSEINVYPNPIQDIMNVNLNGQTEALITISDITGKIVSTENITKDNTTINTSNFAKGQYFVNILNKELNVTKMIIK